MSRKPFDITPGSSAENPSPRFPAASDPELLVVLEAYLDDLAARASPAHCRNVTSRLRRVTGVLECHLVSDLRAVDVIRIRNQAKANGAANRTANLLVDSLRALLTWATETGIIRESPLPRIRRLPETREHQRYRRRALRESEISIFLAAAADDDATSAILAARAREIRVPQLPLWIGLMETGARWSELRRVRWCDLGGERRLLLLRADTTKSKRARAVPLRVELAERLTELRDAHGRLFRIPPQDTDRVFLTPRGLPWPGPTTNAMRIFDRVLDRAGILKVDADGERVDIHALRHCFASRLARAGVGLMQAQRLLGHADPKTTAMIYAHLESEDLRSAIESLPALLTAGTDPAPQLLESEVSV